MPNWNHFTLLCLIGYSFSEFTTHYGLFGDEVNIITCMTAVLMTFRHMCWTENHALGCV